MGKAAAKMATIVVSSEGEDDDVQPSGLDYDEHISVDESDNTGSEFQESEDDQSHSDMAQDSEEEATMLSVAVQRSLQASRRARVSANSAGPSRQAPVPAQSSTASTRKTTEKRSRSGKFVQKSSDESSGDESEPTFISSDEEPLHKVKGKKNSKSKKNAAKNQDAGKAKNNVLSNLLAEPMNARQRTMMEKRMIKQEEMALRRKLGRKLTMVMVWLIWFGAHLTHVYQGRESYTRTATTASRTEARMGRC
jgi:DNA repair protein RAD16